MICWSSGLSSIGRNASTSRHNNDSIELDVMTAIQPLRLLSLLSQQAKKRVSVLARVTDPDYQGVTGLVTDVRKSMARKKESFRVSLNTTMPCD